MKLLYQANSAQIGGGNRSLLMLMQGMQQLGHDLSVVIPSSGPIQDACAQAGINWIIHPTYQPSWRSPVRLALELMWWRRELRRRQIEVVHANDPITARPILLAARAGHIPVVVHVRFPQRSGLIRWVFRGIPKPAALIFNSRAMRSTCGPDFARTCPKSKQFVIHNAADLDEFRPSPIPCASKRVGILANLIPIKGHSDFLQMARLLMDRRIDAEYWLIGGEIHHSEYQAELKRLCRDLGLCECVQFLGHRNDVAELLNALDVVVCASHVEPFGRCLIEAMACAKPVVATRVGGIPEVVDDGVTGILVPPHSPEQLADSVARLLTDSELSVRMGNAGRMRVEQHFTPDAHLDAVLDVYGSVLKQQ